MMQISESTIKKWAQSFASADSDDVNNELQLMALEIAAGEYRPGVDFDNPENYKLLYLHLKERLGEKQISVGGTGGADEESTAFGCATETAASLQLHDGDDDHGVESAELDDVLADLNSLRNIPTLTLQRMFEVEARQARNIRHSDLIQNLIHRTAKSRGLSPAQLTALEKRLQEEHAKEQARLTRTRSAHPRVQR